MNKTDQTEELQRVQKLIGLKKYEQPSEGSAFERAVKIRQRIRALDAAANADSSNPANHPILVTAMAAVLVLAVGITIWFQTGHTTVSPAITAESEQPKPDVDAILAAATNESRRPTGEPFGDFRAQPAGYRP